MDKNTLGQHSVSGNPLTIRGHEIREDANGLVCLDDIWVLAKASITRVPSKWRATKAAKQLANELWKKITVSALKEKTDRKPIAYAKRGRGNTGTYAHPILAAAYAGYLSPKLELEVREVWLRYRAGDATLADEILQHASPEDNKWAAMRAMARARRVDYTDTLKNHGVFGKGFPRCTNAVYAQILDGPAHRVRISRGLPTGTNLRDHLGTDELSFIMAAEMLATDRIEEEECFGNSECETASARSAGFIREAIQRDKQDRRKRPRE